MDGGCRSNPDNSENHEDRRESGHQDQSGKAPPPVLEPTRTWRGKTPDEWRAQRIAEANKKYRDNGTDVKKKRNSHPNDSYTQDEDDLILDMTDGGATLEEISEILGRSEAGVRYRLKKLRTG